MHLHMPLTTYWTDSSASQHMLSSTYRIWDSLKGASVEQGLQTLASSHSLFVSIETSDPYLRIHGNQRPADDMEPL